MHAIITAVKKQHYILWIILIVAAFLRFYNFSSWSLSNDELSAWSRLHFDTFKMMIREGVQHMDYHPAFVQSFLYFWVKITGDSEAALRLPFVIAGILSVVIIFQIGKLWFNQTAGWFAAAALATLQFPILYSQLARPYSMGLCFILVDIYFWTLILFDTSSRKKIFNGIVYTIAATLCLYTHYFSFLSAFIVGLTGLFFFKKDNYKIYLLTNFAVIMLFLPHLQITLFQLSAGGVGWLSKPSADYFWNYLDFAFNYSLFLKFIFIGIFISIVCLNYKKITYSKFQLISICWFLLPFFIGYYYSIYVAPLLQYSLLLFSFPCLILFIFSFIKENNKRANFVLLFVLICSGVFSTVIENKFYTTQFFSTFKDPAIQTDKWEKEYGVQNVTRLYTGVSKSYLDYYFNKYKLNNSFSFLANGSPQPLEYIKKAVEQAQTPYFIFGYLNGANYNEAYELIKQKFPKVKDDVIYYNSRISLFEKKPNYRRDTLLHIINSFEFNNKAWKLDTNKIDKYVFHAGKKSLKVDSLSEFTCNYETTVGELFKDSSQFIVLKYWINTSGKSNIHLVITFDNEKGNYEWRTAHTGNFYVAPNKWTEIILIEALPEQAKLNDHVSIYLWNPDKNNVHIDDIELASFKDMNYQIFYGKQ